MSLDRILGPLRRRIGLLVGRAVLESVDDAKLAQVLQVAILAGETRRLERFQEYGFTSHPFAGAEAVVVSPNADRAQGIIVAVEDRRYRLKALPEGEVALYDDLGNVVHLQRGEVLVNAVTKAHVLAPEIVAEALTGVGKITAQASATVEATAGTSITLTAPQINLNGNVSAGPGGNAPGLSIDGSSAKLQSGTAGGKAFVQVQGANVDVDQN